LKQRLEVDFLSLDDAQTADEAVQRVFEYVLSLDELFLRNPLGGEDCVRCGKNKDHHQNMRCKKVLP